MPNTREKLIELLDGVQDYGFCRSTVEEPQCRVINSIIADHLIANGVQLHKRQKAKPKKKVKHTKKEISQKTLNALEAMGRKAHGED